MNGHISLYDLYDNRPSSKLIYPFVTKTGNFTSFNTISDQNFAHAATGDILQGK